MHGEFEVVKLIVEVLSVHAKDCDRIRTSVESLATATKTQMPNNFLPPSCHPTIWPTIEQQHRPLPTRDETHNKPKDEAFTCSPR